MGCSSFILRINYFFLCLCVVLFCGFAQAQQFNNKLNDNIPLSHCVNSWCFGIDIPNGLAAVNYIYGPEGTWRHIDGLRYRYNYYKSCSDSAAGHPYNRAELVKEANGSKFYTAGDGDCHLLFHAYGDTIQRYVNAYAFEEHNGRGAGGKILGNPFSNFWYDDNWLAHYMSSAYSKSTPAGLTMYSGFVRWKIIDGSTHGWTLYHNDQRAVDLLALNGLYYFAVHEPFNAFLKFNTIISLSGAAYNRVTKQYDFTRMQTVYYYGLALILVTKLMDSRGLPHNVQGALVPYALSLRAHLLQLQQKKDGHFISWLSGDSAHDLINTETTVSAVLGLSTDAFYTFEADGMAVAARGEIINRKNNTIIAIPGKTKIGAIARTVPVSFLYGSHHYKAVFYLRGNKADVVGAHIGRVNVVGASGETLFSQDIVLNCSDSKTWTREVISIPVHDNGKLSFTVIWAGHNTLQVSLIRII